MVGWAQVLIVSCSTSMSSGLEVKLEPEERDSQTSCGKERQLAPRPRACVRLTPNSANCCATKAVPLSPFWAAAIAFGLASPSLIVEAGWSRFAPQQGMLSVLTKQVPLLPPA